MPKDIKDNANINDGLGSRFKAPPVKLKDSLYAE